MAQNMGTMSQSTATNAASMRPLFTIAEANIMHSPMLKRINHIISMHTDDTLICIACGIVFAALTMSFFI